MKDLIPNAVLTILAPTASGKTDLMIEWAKRYPIEIVSVDSAMVYRELTIGANKPSKQELHLCPHHVVDVTTIHQGYDLARFFDDSAEAIADILQRGKIPVLVGGTMMYIYQIYRGLAPVPLIDKEKRSIFSQDFEKMPLEEHYQELQRVDPVFAAGVERTDKQRISRGLEVFHLTGKRLSDYWSLPPKKYPYDLSICGLQVADKEAHKRKVSKRAQLMIEHGFIQEVQDLKKLYESSDYEFWSFVGYRQVRSFLDGQISEAELLPAIERSTWQLVKRQKTWLKKFDIPKWDIDLLSGEVSPEFTDIFEKYCRFVLERGIALK